MAEDGTVTTSYEIDSHGRPPFPEEVVKSKVKELQPPTAVGATRTTDGARGLAGAVTDITCKKFDKLNLTCTWLDLKMVDHNISHSSHTLRPKANKRKYIYFLIKIF